MRATALLLAPLLALICLPAEGESITEQWAQVIVDSQYEDLSPEIVERVKLCLLDSIAVMLFTSSLEDSEIYLERPLANGGRPEATIWGIGKKVPVETAAACNAFLIHGHEIDDTDFRSGIKISCVTAAPALAVAEYGHTSGKDLILASAISYTVTGRLAAVTPSLQWMGFMPSGMWGPGGAASATAKLLDFDKEQTVWALGLALGGGQGSFQYWYDQTMDKKIIVARASRIGVESALLASKGWVGPAHILEGPAGIYHGLMKGYMNVNDLRVPIQQGLKDLIPAKNVKFANILIDFQPNFDTLTQDFKKLDGPLYVYPKFQACSSSIGPFLDALDPVYENANIDVDNIDHVVVGRDWPIESTWAQKIVHFEPPKTLLGAQLSMNFVISLYLHNGSASPHDLVQKALHNESILDLARKVTLEQVPGGDEFFIKVVLKDGREVSASFRPSTGATYEPIAYKLRMKKFRMLTRDILDDSGRKKLKNMIDNLENVDDVAEWTQEIHELLKRD